VCIVGADEELVRGFQGSHDGSFWMVIR
jgi:hypothetical protein